MNFPELKTNVENKLNCNYKIDYKFLNRIKQERKRYYVEQEYIKKYVKKDSEKQNR